MNHPDQFVPAETGRVLKLDAFQKNAISSRVPVRYAAVRGLAQAVQMYPQALEAMKQYEAVPAVVPIERYAEQAMNATTTVDFAVQPATESAEMNSAANPLLTSPNDPVETAQDAVAQAYMAMAHKTELGQNDVAQAA